ncbi:MAG: cyclic beta 1-2 glucan synthetase, partial [Casimicrobiaceae bacterium]
MTQFRTRLRTAVSPRRPFIEELPLRAELFSADQMERHGKTLAAMHRLTPRHERDQLLPRLAANETALIGVCERLTASVSANHRISPAGEWLLDNFHLIEEQISTAKRHLPRGYSRELPRLANGPSTGLPRVYDIALETISHGDGRVDAEGLSRFVTAYQTVTTLNLGELWAIPIMLRLALIENLRRVGVRIAAGRSERDLANTWADEMMGIAERDPKSLILVVADMARSLPPMGSAFVAELARRLQGQSAALALALTWIEQHLAESHLTIEQLVQAENQQQASEQVSISNSIGSLRFLSAIDWRDFVESVSAVEHVLRQDPAAVYGAMQFATRDSYRHAVERIAREGHLTELEVAATAIELARAASAGDAPGDPATHVGYHLMDKGLPELERAVGVEDSIGGALRRIGSRYPLPLYLGSIAAITGLTAAGLAANVHGTGAGREMMALVVVLSLLATSQFAVTVVNWLTTLLVTPRPLPRMDYSAGIAAKARTLVVVPSMLTSLRNVEDLVEALEVRFLANRDAHLHFALLTDFADARAQSLDTDEPLLRLAAARIEELNRKYGPVADASSPDKVAGAAGAERAESASAFYLFHRPRRWNAKARIWMGQERKRGKLGDLNALLRGGSRDGFSLIVGATPILSQVKYVITLDTDTQLPRDAARQFVGAMAHPLNTPRFDETGKNTSREIVTSGYGILQPRVSVSLPGTNRSRYARLYGGEPGIDQYTRTVSDVYQDAFDEGSFIGKGIYDVDAFERALKGRFPENRVLSHDLLEGCYARAGLLSDAELYEEFPARYSADVARRRRWIRGDWQLMGWLRRRVPGAEGRERNPLSMLSQWKVFDNLRRSLVPPTLVALLLLGWTVLAPAGLWTAVVIGILFAPAAIATLSDLASKPVEAPLRQHLAAVGFAVRRHGVQAVVALAFLPYEAWYCLDAIVRTIGRLLITQRRLLEWNPSSDVDRALEEHDRTDLLASYRTMAIAPAIALGAWIALSLTNATALAIAGPILLLWAASPAIAWWISRPLARRSARLLPDQIRFLRKLARRTWGYFETYVGPDDHWLPPDNVQEHPEIRVAHRTSPTNMGLALLANLTAHDFGYLSTGQLVTR